MEQLEREKVAFVETYGAYRIVATYLLNANGDDLIEIFKNGDLVKAFRWPGYKIWNIQAHAEDIIEGLERGSSDGIYEAGSTGFGGNVYSEPR